MSLLPTATQFVPPIHEIDANLGVPVGSGWLTNVEPPSFEVAATALPDASAPTATHDDEVKQEMALNPALPTVAPPG
jgi:hypothetical protein